jgi:hypothetical protein
VRSGLVRHLLRLGASILVATALVVVIVHHLPAVDAPHRLVVVEVTIRLVGMNGVIEIMTAGTVTVIVIETATETVNEIDLEVQMTATEI